MKISNTKTEEMNRVNARVTLITNALLRSLLLIWIVIPVTAHSLAIDLNDFRADPTVTVATDGRWALIAEDPALSVVLLANDPGLGDRNIIIPGPGLSLSFNYVFNEGTGEDDEFGAFIVDSSSGFSAGQPYEFFIQDTSSGTLTFDLSGLTGRTIGLQFQLASGFNDTGASSTVLISDVQIVPEAATLYLIATGMAGLVTLRLWPLAHLSRHKKTA